MSIHQNSKVDFMRTPFLWQAKPNLSAKNEKRAQAQNLQWTKPRFSQYRAGAYMASAAFPLFPTRRKTQLLICRSLPTPRKTQHPLKGLVIN